MSGLATLPNTGFRPPNTNAKFVLIVLGVVGLGLAIYFGTTVLVPKGVQTSANAAGSTSASSGTGGSTAASTPASTPASSSVCSSSQTTILSPTTTDFSIWKSGMNTWISGQLALSTTTPTTLASAITGLTAKQTEIDGVKACLDEKYAVVQGAATTNATLTATQANILKTIEQRKADIEIAKDRALLAIEPGYNRSNYDGWFPIDRPLRQQTIPILIGFTLFFICTCFLSVLSMLRLDIRLLVPQLSGGPGTPLAGQAKQPLFLATMGLLVTVTGLMIWAFVRK